MGEALLVRRIELAHMSTQHAIDLHLLTEDEAAAIWRDAERRHPALAQFDGSVLEEAAARLPAQPAFGDQLA